MDFGIIAIETYDQDLIVEAFACGSKWHLMGFFYHHFGETMFIISSPFLHNTPKWATCRYLNDLVNLDVVKSYVVRPVLGIDDRIRKYFDLTLASKVRTFKDLTSKAFFQRVFTSDGLFPKVPVIELIEQIINTLFDFIRHESPSDVPHFDFNSLHPLIGEDQQMHETNVKANDMIEMNRNQIEFKQLNIKTSELLEKLLIIAKTRNIGDVIAPIAKFTGVASSESNVDQHYDLIVSELNESCRRGNLNVEMLKTHFENMRLDLNVRSSKRLNERWPSTISTTIGPCRNNALVNGIYDLGRMIDMIRSSKGRVPQININTLVTLNNALSEVFSMRLTRDYFMPEDVIAKNFAARYEIEGNLIQHRLKNGKMIEMGVEGTPLNKLTMIEIKELKSMLAERSSLYPGLGDYVRMVAALKYA